jgi:hypothetical protein
MVSLKGGKGRQKGGENPSPSFSLQLVEKGCPIAGMFTKHIRGCRRRIVPLK